MNEIPKKATLKNAIKVSGRGGGDKAPVEAKNTYRTNNIVRCVELLGEGEIVGLVNGAKSIYFDQTPLQNDNGTFNFRGVEWAQRVGLPDQPSLEGNPAAESTTVVETRVRNNIGPVVRTIAEPNATAARVVIRVPSLQNVDKKGNIKGSTVSWSIERRNSGGGWVTIRTVTITEKFNAACQFAERIPLPEGGAPWDIRVTRLTADSDSVKLSNETWWESYTTLIENRFTYPNSALVWLRFNAALFSQSSIPTRYFRVRGRIVKVPSNYTASTRTYSGIWNGTFQLAYTNNPAWILYDLLINDRYGLGEFIDEARIDKWSLYQIAQYCDELVPDGFGGQEPRYTFNGVINNRDEAFKVLQQITTSFRGMAFWSLGQVFAFADMPEDPSMLVTPSNVIDGDINYPGVALKARHSVAMVTWNDPQDFYRPAVEVIIDDEMLHRFGWREVAIQAIGCTSRGLAARYGKWILENERNSNDAAEYGASWDHAEMRPGKIISIADTRKAQVRTGGRLISISGTALTLDAPFIPTVGETYSIKVALPNGTLQSKAITSFAGAVVNIASALSQTPVPGAVWVITGTDVAPRQFRVLSLNETEDNVFKVNAIFHDPGKYSRIENNLSLAPLAYSRMKTLIDPISNLTINEEISFDNGQPSTRIVVSWTPPNDFMWQSFWVYADTPLGFVNYGTTNLTSYTIPDATAGDWKIYVVALGAEGRRSVETSDEITTLGWTGVAAPQVVDLKIFGRNDLVYGGKEVRITWRNVFHNSTVADEDLITADDPGVANPFYFANIVRVLNADTDAVLRTETMNTNSYTYTYDKNLADGGPRRRVKFQVLVQDTLGRTSAATAITVNNPVPELVAPVITNGVELGFVSMPNSADIDQVGVRVWVSTTSGYNPAVAAPIYDGPNNFVSLPIIPGVPHYVRAAWYDEFGKTELNVSTEQTILSSANIDENPPSVPTGLALTASTITTGSGEIISRISADWTDVASANLAYYEVQIRQGAGSYVSYQTGTSLYVFDNLVAGLNYTVQVRAVSKMGVPSAFATAVSINALAKTTPPATPGAPIITASLKSAYLSWSAVADTDISHYEVWRHTADVSGSATRIGTSGGLAFSNLGLTTGTPYFYWLKAVNTSGVASAFSPSGTVTPGQVQNGDIAANAITADKITAGTITGDRINTTTALPATITVGVTGVNIGTIESRAADPAARVNAFTTTIDPGKILISGATTLASWRNGTDATKIEGGSIAANTILANSIKVGSRGLSISGLDFTVDKNTNTVSWTAGSIIWVNDSGVTTTTGISSGSYSNASTSYIYWEKAATTLTGTTSASTAMTADRVIMAQYSGGAALRVLYGGTIIDGTRIVALSIAAGQLAADSVTASKIQADAVTATKIAALAVTADKINGGTLNAATAINIGGTNFKLSAPDQNMTVSDGTFDRVKIGRLGVGVWGLEVRDASNNIILSSGSGVAAAAVTGLGAFATLNQVTAANVSTYIANAAIKDAQIESLTAAKITATSLSAISANVGTLTAGVIKSAGVNPKIYIDLDAGTLKALDGEFAGKLGAVELGVAENMILKRGAKILDGQWPPWDITLTPIGPLAINSFFIKSEFIDPFTTLGRYYFTDERALTDPYCYSGTASTTASWLMPDGTIRTTANIDTDPTGLSTIIGFLHPLDWNPGFLNLSFPHKMFCPALGFDKDFLVPDGCTKIKFKGWGGGGGNSTNINAAAGAGGYVEGIFDVTPGDKIRVQTGAGGATGGVFIFTSNTNFQSRNNGYAGAGVSRFGTLARASGAGRTALFKVNADNSVVPLFIAAGGGSSESGGGLPGGPDGLYGSYHTNWAGGGGIGEPTTANNQGGGGGGWRGGIRGQGGANYVHPSATSTQNLAGTGATPPNTSDADYVEFVNRTSPNYAPGRAAGLNPRSAIIHTAPSATNARFGNGGLTVIELLNT